MSEETSKPTKAPGAPDGSVKETIESILVAFILAFVFRAFVVEAFVIPTGSMGPTLMGAHMRLHCPDCGYQFAVNYSIGPSDDDTNIPSEGGQDRDYLCPNCGHVFPATREPMPVYYGDRILVLKYRYLFSEPAPWDVVVFKSPYEKHRDPRDPKYVDNYIKRLIARPGESIMVLDGDVYIGRKGMAPEQFQIRRKTNTAQASLWRDVYDNDYVPHGTSTRPLSEWYQPWVVDDGTGWAGPRPAGRWAAPERIFHFDNQAGSSTIHFDSTVNHAAGRGEFDSLSDWLAYDQTASNGVYVTDLKLSCAYQRTAGQGALRMQLTKRDDCFTAEFLPGRVRLMRNKFAADATGGLGAAVWSQPREVAVADLNGHGPVDAELANVDYRVSVRVNGHEVLATSDADYTPDVAALYREAIEAHRGYGQPRIPKPLVRISADHQACSLDHVHLSRDVYYLNYQGGQGRYDEFNHTVGPFWSSPENIVDLGPDEYFVMGDNAQVSLDARFWGAPVDLPREGDYHVAAGRVPGRFMLGKAFFVYWPAGYRPPSLSFGIEPDFGDMRSIH